MRTMSISVFGSRHRFDDCRAIASRSGMSANGRNVDSIEYLLELQETLDGDGVLQHRRDTGYVKKSSDLRCFPREHRSVSAFLVT